MTLSFFLCKTSQDNCEDHRRCLPRPTALHSRTSVRSVWYQPKTQEALVPTEAQQPAFWNESHAEESLEQDGTLGVPKRATFY